MDRQQARIRQQVARLTSTRRADPNDYHTWHEVADFQPLVKKRFKLGGWVAVHVRVQGVRALFGSNSMGVLETVPPTASFGYPDWLAWHPHESRMLVLELKTETGVVDSTQRAWLTRFALAGCDVAVVRPRHVCLPQGMDLLHRRLVLHEACPVPCPGGSSCTGWCRVRWRVVA